MDGSHSGLSLMTGLDQLEVNRVFGTISFVRFAEGSLGCK